MQKLGRIRFLLSLFTFPLVARTTFIRGRVTLPERNPLSGFQTRSETVNMGVGEATQNFTVRASFGEQMNVGSRAIGAKQKKAVPVDVGRGHERLASGAILLATSLAVALALPMAAAQTATAEAAFEECRVLMTMDVNKAIARCEEAVRLDPKLPDPYFMIGNAHNALWQQETRTSATPDDARIQEHRRKATENYKKFLALNRGDTESLRRARHTALSELLGLYIFGGEKEGDLEYANELAKEPALARRDLFILAAVYARHERPDLSEEFLKRQLEADPSDAEACQILARLYNEPSLNVASRFDGRIGYFETCVAQSPSDPTGYYQLAMLLWDKAFRDQTLTDKQKLLYVERGLGHVDRALGLKKDFWEAMIFKVLLLRLKAMAVSDPALQQRLRDEANALQLSAVALKAAGVPRQPGLAAPPPPPPAPLADAVGGVEGGIPEGVIRLGGDVPEPRKLKDVPADYPEMALKARVHGVVILECMISRQGNVVDVNVLQGNPFLNQAAIDAVKQWVYEPTLMNGMPIALIMTVTVSFNLR